MAKNALKKVISSLLLVFFTACSAPPPTYSRKNIAEVIKNIVKDEFKTEINAWLVGNTVWVFAPLKLFNEKGKLKVDEEGKPDEDLLESIRKISDAINRAILNIDTPPTFYCFIKSDIMRAEGIDLLRLDSYELAFVPDQIKFNMASLGLGMLISTKELNDRTVIFQIPSMDSLVLKDQKGNYLYKYDISLPEFILLLIQQNIIRAFLSEEYKDNFEINELDLDYDAQSLKIKFNIKFKKFEEGLPVPLEKIQEITKETASNYSSFVTIPRAVIQDTFNEKTKILTFAADSKLTPSALTPIQVEQAHSLLKLSQASFYTALASELRNEDKSLTTAANFCKKALIAFPDYLYALTLLAEIYSQLNQPDQALLFLNQAAGKDPQNPLIHIRLGELYQALGKPQEALTHFKDAASLYPEYPGIFSKLCLAYISLGNSEEALKYLEKAVKQTEEQKINTPENYRQLGDCHAQLGQYDKALIYLNKAKDLKPDYLAVYLSLGETYRLMGNSQEAVKNFEKALSLNPDSGPAHLGLAHTYVVLGQYELAIAEYEKAIPLSPESSEMYINLALAHSELGLSKPDSSQYDRAIAYLKKALKLSPDNFRVYYSLGETYANAGKNYEAAEYFQEALKLNADSAESYFGLGRAWHALGQSQKAKENFLKAHQIFYAHKDYLNAQKAEENLRNIP